MQDRPDGETCAVPREGRLLEELGSLRTEVEGLRRLLEVSRGLSSILEPGALLDAILDSAILLTGARRGLLLAQEDGRLRVVLARGDRKDSLDPDTVLVSETLAGRCLEENRVIPYDNLGTQPEFQEVRSIRALSLESAVCVPLRERGVARGVLYLDSSTPGVKTSPREISLLEAFAAQASISMWNARLLRESEESRLILSRQNADLRAEVQARKPLGEILGQSPAMQKVFDRIRFLKDTDLPVLLLGESGTGKELAARALHYEGLRRDGPFVPVNCAGLPGELLDSLMFGHRKGAFTGAVQDMPGLVEQAEGGTLFLDEIGDMPLSLQVKLLRFLESGEYRRVGESDLRKAGVRVVSATNRDIGALVREKSFREDLFFRLAAVCVEVPPLRDRREDLPVLISHFTARAEGKMGRKSAGLTAGARAFLLGHPWPGNVRQLKHAVEAACALVPEGQEVDETLLRILFPAGELTSPGASPAPGGSTSSCQPSDPLTGRMLNATPSQATDPMTGPMPSSTWGRPMEHGAGRMPSSTSGRPSDRTGSEQSEAAETLRTDQEILEAVLTRYEWNVSKAAEVLGLSRQSVYNRIRMYNLRRP